MSLAGFQRRRRELAEQENTEPKKVSGSDDNKPRESKKRAATKRKSKG